MGELKTFAACYGIPFKSFSFKRDLVKFIITLTSDDIKNGYILLVSSQNSFGLTDNMFTGYVNVSDVTVRPLSYDKYTEHKYFTLNRVKITIEQLKQAVKIKKIKKIKNNIELKKDDNSIYVEMGQVYDEFGLNMHDINSSIQSNINQLVKALIKERKKKNKKKVAKKVAN